MHSKRPRFLLILTISVILLSGCYNTTSTPTQVSSSTNRTLSTEVDGDWWGTYTCKQGITGLKLEINSIGNKLKAVFNFYAVSQNPGVPSGKFTMTGIREGNKITLIPEQWINQPNNYHMVPIDGFISSNGTMSGTICDKTFSLSKK